MMEVHIDPPPNKGLAAVLVGSQMRTACLIFARRAAALYQARVHKDSGDLAAATTAGVTTIETRWGPRYAGEVVVDSEHFLPHEEGWDEDGQHHEGAHDFNAILGEMAGGV